MTDPGSGFQQALMAAATGLALVGAAGCGAKGAESGDSGSPAPPPAVTEFTKLDACKILTPDDLASAGVEGPGSPEQDISSEPGCYYDGDSISVTSYKNTKETVDSSAKKPVWAKFDQVDINGRPGATAVNTGSTQARVCSTMFNAGNGMIRVAVRTQNPGDESQCEQALKIAETVESRMPEPA